MKIIYDKKPYTILSGKSIINRKVFNEFKFESIEICDGSQYINCTLKIEGEELVLKRLAVECPKDFDQEHKINGVAPRVLSKRDYMILSYKGLSEKFNISMNRKNESRIRHILDEFDIPSTITFGTGFMKDAYEKNYKMYLDYRDFPGVAAPYILWHTNEIWYQKVYEAQIVNGKVVKISDISKDVKAKRKFDLTMEIPLSNPIMKEIVHLSKKWVMENKDGLSDGTEGEKIRTAIDCLIKKMSALKSQVDVDDAKLKKLAELSSKWVEKNYEEYYKKFKSRYVRNKVRGGIRISKNTLWNYLWSKFCVTSMMFRILRYKLCRD